MSEQVFQLISQTEKYRKKNCNRHYISKSHIYTHTIFFNSILLQKFTTFISDLEAGVCKNSYFILIF